MAVVENGGACIDVPGIRILRGDLPVEVVHRTTLEPAVCA